MLAVGPCLALLLGRLGFPPLVSAHRTNGPGRSSRSSSSRRRGSATHYIILYHFVLYYILLYYLTLYNQYVQISGPGWSSRSSSSSSSRGAATHYIIFIMLYYIILYYNLPSIFADKRTGVVVAQQQQPPPRLRHVGVQPPRLPVVPAQITVLNAVYRLICVSMLDRLQPPRLPVVPAHATFLNAVYRLIYPRFDTRSVAAATPPRSPCTSYSLDRYSIGCCRHASP